MSGLKDVLRRAASLVVEMDPVQEPRVYIAPDDYKRANAEIENALKQSSPAAVKGATASPQVPPVSVPPTPPTAPRTLEQVVRDAPGPNLDQIKVTPETAQQVMIHTDDTIDYQMVYKAAGVNEVPFTAEQTLQMMAALPQELPAAMKQQMLKVSIEAMGKAMGVSSETIVADATRKLAALASFADHHSSDTDAFLAASQQAISQWEIKITELKAKIESAQAQRQAIIDQCTAESDRLDDILELFSSPTSSAST